MQRQIPLIFEDGRPLNRPAWREAWARLWIAAGSAPTRWHTAAEWAQLTGVDAERVRYLLGAASTERLMRRRPGRSRDGSRRYARTDVVAQKWSATELAVFDPAGWRWTYSAELVEYLTPPEPLLAPELDPDVLNAGEAAVVAALPRQGVITRSEVWHRARRAGSAKNTFYAAWGRLAGRGVLVRLSSPGLWRYVPSGERA